MKRFLNFNIKRRHTYNDYLREARTVLERDGMTLEKVRDSIKNNRQWNVKIEGGEEHIRSVTSYFDLYFRRYHGKHRKNPHLYMSTVSDDRLFTFCHKYDAVMVRNTSSTLIYQWLDAWHTTPTFNYYSGSYLYDFVEVSDVSSYK